MSAVTQRVYGRDVQVGDLLTDPPFTGLVTALVPYTGALADILGDGTQIATIGPDNTITLPAFQWFTVTRTAVTA